jgi:hypothetical protein
MLQDDDKKPGIQPDPETLGPEPQEHMKGPISSIVKKVEDMMNDNDQDDEEVEKKEKEKKVFDTLRKKLLGSFAAKLKK